MTVSGFITTVFTGDYCSVSLLLLFAACKTKDHIKGAPQQPQPYAYPNQGYVPLDV